LKTTLFIFLSLFCISSYTLAQEVDVPEDYISEIIYGINLNTNGGDIGGVMIKSTKIIKPKVYRSIGLEIVQVKSPKEVRIQNNTGNIFTIGKKNYLYSFRPQYGRDFILFRKAPEEGIQISAVFAAGLSFGLLVPYHVLYNFPNGQILSVAYDPNVHTIDNIIGPGNLLDGVGNSKILLGINAKAGMSLDFGAFRNSISGVEVGFTFEAFTNTPELITSPTPSNPPAPNNQFFTAIYANIFFGSRK
jgi:hypothetical protein